MPLGHLVQASASQAQQASGAGRHGRLGCKLLAYWAMGYRIPFRFEESNEPKHSSTAGSPGELGERLGPVCFNDAMLLQSGIERPLPYPVP